MVESLQAGARGLRELLVVAGGTRCRSIVLGPEFNYRKILGIELRDERVRISLRSDAANHVGRSAIRSRNASAGDGGSSAVHNLRHGTCYQVRCMGLHSSGWSCGKSCQCGDRTQQNGNADGQNWTHATTNYCSQCSGPRSLVQRKFVAIHLPESKVRTCE